MEVRTGGEEVCGRIRGVRVKPGAGRTPDLVLKLRWAGDLDGLSNLFFNYLYLGGEITLMV